MKSMEVLNQLSLKKLVLGLRCGFIRYFMLLLVHFSVKIVSLNLNYIAAGITLSDYAIITQHFPSHSVPSWCCMLRIQNILFCHESSFSSLLVYKPCVLVYSKSKLRSLSSLHVGL